MLCSVYYDGHVLYVEQDSLVFSWFLKILLLYFNIDVSEMNRADFLLLYSLVLLFALLEELKVSENQMVLVRGHSKPMYSILTFTQLNHHTLTATVTNTYIYTV